jgi:mono/diheme cytochrome c family protein
VTAVTNRAAQLRTSAIAVLAVAWLTACASIAGPNAIGELSPSYSPEAQVLDQGKDRYRQSCSACEVTGACGNGYAGGPWQTASMLCPSGSSTKAP